jgi:hypothetical protein
MSIKAERFLPSTRISSWINYSNPSASRNRFPPVDSGLVGLYDAESWTGTQWSDISGTNNHATSITGSPSLTNISGNGSSLTISSLQGATNAGIRFPSAAILPSTYTLFHVTRYTGTTNLRIVTGVNNNWLSGHWGGLSGVAFHEGWITQNSSSIHGNNWVISTDQNSLYRSNGVTRGSSGGSASTQLSINWGAFTEFSTWNITFLCVYNRTLNATEYQQVESWLSSRYGITI